jgi:hypothetical protein
VVGVDLQQVVQAALVHVLDPRVVVGHHGRDPFPQVGQVEVAGHPVQGLPDVVGQQAEDPPGQRVEAAHPAVALDHHQAGADGVLDVAEGGVEAAVFLRLAAQLGVEGRQLLVGGLQLFVGGLQLLAGQLQLFVEGLVFLVGGFHLLDHRLQVLAGVGELLAQAGDLVGRLDGREGLGRPGGCATRRPAPPRS